MPLWAMPDKLDTERLDKLIVACEPFVSFMQFVEAGRELDGEAQMAADTAILYWSGNGASAQITVGQWRALLEAAEEGAAP